MKRSSAAFTLMTPAAPSPCRMRAATSTGRVGASPQASDASVNTTMPTM
jgi:hypothetical protein